MEGIHNKGEEMHKSKIQQISHMINKQNVMSINMFNLQLIPCKWNANLPFSKETYFGPTVVCFHIALHQPKTLISQFKASNLLYLLSTALIGDVTILKAHLASKKG